MVQTFVLFNVQSNIKFSEWGSLLTLCLAPLLVHILAGVPSPVYLWSRRPRWHEYLGHFNPTSIVWRYFAITDRRARTKPSMWTSTTMTSSNALFWTSSGWDGSEKMIERSTPFRVRQPQGTHMHLFSFSALKTVIVACQGVQALYMLLNSLVNGVGLQGLLSIATIFFPLATFGLLRLPAAMWLTDFEHYRHQHEEEPKTSHIYEPVLTCNCSTKYIASTAHPKLVLGDAAIDYQTACPWQAIMVRAFFLLFILFLVGVGLAQMVPFKGTNLNLFTLTSLVMGIFYIIFLGITAFTLAFYILSGHASTTVLPCINHIWYKVYTVAIFAMMGLVLITAAVETRLTPCGRLTTLAPIFDAWNDICGSSTYIVPLDSPGRNRSPLPWMPPTHSYNKSSWSSDWQYPGNEINAPQIAPAFGIIWKLPNGTYEVVSFDGWCQLGTWKSTGYFDLMTEKISTW